MGKVAFSWWAMRLGWLLILKTIFAFRAIWELLGIESSVQILKNQKSIFWKVFALENCPKIDKIHYYLQWAEIMLLFFHLVPTQFWDMHFRGQNLFFKILILRKILWHISFYTQLLSYGLEGKMFLDSSINPNETSYSNNCNETSYLKFTCFYAWHQQRQTGTNILRKTVLPASTTMSPCHAPPSSDGIMGKTFHCVRFLAYNLHRQ